MTKSETARERVWTAVERRQTAVSRSDFDGINSTTTEIANALTAYGDARAAEAEIVALRKALDELDLTGFRSTFAKTALERMLADAEQRERAMG